MKASELNKLIEIIANARDEETHIDGDGIYWDECFPQDGNVKYKKVGQFAWGGNPSVRSLSDIKTIIEQADKITELQAGNSRLKILLDNGIKAHVQNAIKTLNKAGNL